MYPHVYLIAGTNADSHILANKGQFVRNENERAELLAHCKWVDEVVIGAPWRFTGEWCKSMGIHYLCHDDAPYTMGADATGDTFYDTKRTGYFRPT